MKRLEVLSYDTTYPMNSYMEECSDGDYVRYDDAIETIDQLRADKAELEAQILYWKVRSNGFQKITSRLVQHTKLSITDTFKEVNDVSNRE